MFFFAKFDLQYKWDMHFFYLVSDERKVGHLQGQRVLAKRSDKSGMVWDPVQAREFAKKFKIDEATQNLDPEDQDTDGKDGEDEEPIPDGEAPVDTDGVDAAVGLMDDPEVSLED